MGGMPARREVASCSGTAITNKVRAARRSVVSQARWYPCRELRTGSARRLLVGSVTTGGLRGRWCSRIEGEPVSRAREDRDVGVRPDEAFDFVQDLLRPPRRGGDHAEPDARSLPCVLVGHLCNRDAEASTGGVDEVPQDRPVVLERAALR